jgi:hypothetical protein
MLVRLCRNGSHGLVRAYKTYPDGLMKRIEDEWRGSSKKAAQRPNSQCV